MNLPPDKVRLLRSYDNEKKWELICDQVGGVHKVNGALYKTGPQGHMFTFMVHKLVFNLIIKLTDIQETGMGGTLGYKHWLVSV